MAAMSASSRARDIQHVSLPLSVRLKAWWHGYDLQLIRKQRLEAALRRQHGVAFEAERQAWEVPHLKVPQLIWGEGFLTPGGATRAAELVKPLGLDESMSVLDIGCGLGGQARLMARDFGAWVTGIEADRELAEAAKLMSEKEGMGRKAQVHGFEPSDVEFRQRAFDVAISTDALYRIETKSSLLGAVSEALKGRAQIVLTDYVRDEEVTQTGALDAWLGSEPGAPELWTAREYRSCLNRLKFDIRVFSDVSEELRRLVIGGFADYLNGAARGGVEPQLQAPLVNEVERWTRLVAALDSGALKAVRVYAQRSQREALLSNW